MDDMPSVEPARLDDERGIGSQLVARQSVYTKYNPDYSMVVSSHSVSIETTHLPSSTTVRLGWRQQEGRSGWIDTTNPSFQPHPKGGVIR